MGEQVSGTKFAKNYHYILPFLQTPHFNFLARPALCFLLTQRQDALLARNDNEYVGYLAMQRHDLEYHIHSISVEEEYRGCGIATSMVLYSIEYVRKQNGEKIRLGGGNNPLTNHMHKSLCTRELELGIKVEPDNWIQILS